MKAQDDGLGVLRENFSPQIVADEEDGKFLGDSAAPAHNLLWQAAVQRAEEQGPI